MTTAELILELQVERLLDPFRAGLLELELNHRVGSVDGFVDDPFSNPRLTVDLTLYRCQPSICTDSGD